MSFTDNFGNPQGLMGRLCLNSMDIEHKAVSLWGISQLDFFSGAHVLDIGCGSGINIRRMLEKVPDGFVYGIDISQESIDKAKKINQKDLGTRCRLKKASVESIPAKEEVFDIVTAFETVYFWPDLQNCMKEVRRVLKQNGRFMICVKMNSEDNKWNGKVKGMNFYSADTLKNMLLNAGFSEVTIRLNANQKTWAALIAEKKEK